MHIAYMFAEDRNYLRDWRNYRGMTQERLAEEVGTTKAVISLLETEKRPLSSKWLRKLALVLETTPGRILDVDPNEESADVLTLWDRIAVEDRPQALRLLRALIGDEGGPRA